VKPNPRKPESTKWSEWLSIIKESISVSWNLALVLFVVLLVIQPEWLGSFTADRISRAKIQKLTLGVVEFERNLEQERALENTTGKLEETAIAIASLERERDMLTQFLVDARVKIADDRLKEQLHDLQSKIENSGSDISNLQTSLTQTIEGSRVLLKTEPTMRMAANLTKSGFLLSGGPIKE